MFIDTTLIIHNYYAIMYVSFIYYVHALLVILNLVILSFKDNYCQTTVSHPFYWTGSNVMHVCTRSYLFSTVTDGYNIVDSFKYNWLINSCTADTWLIYN